MNLFVTALNSGSNGNCYYIGNEKEAILVDAGISCRKIESRMARLGLSMARVKAIFISHEHSDHIKGVRVLSKKHHIPVFITPATLQNAGLDPDNPLIERLKPFEKIRIGDLIISAFPKKHNAWDPQSFVIRNQEICVGVFTDIGAPCENVISHFKCCHAIFLETNYDEQMLMEGNYPYHLKRHISSDIGHLSNDQALDLFLKHRPPFMSHIFLSHISKENNDPQLVLNLFKKHAQGVQVILTSRDQEIPVFAIGKDVKQKPEQLKMFG